MKTMQLYLSVSFALLSLFPGDSFAMTETVNGITWTYTWIYTDPVSIGDASLGSGNVYGTAVSTSTTGPIAIPTSLGRYRVTSIGNYAFHGCSGLTSITIPDSVTNIGNYAFYGCSGLTSILIPDSVTSIGSDAFEGCSGLTSITFPGGVTSIGDWAFRGCSGLTSITIPDSVTNIGNYAFLDCSGLTSITVPGGVTSIGDWAFRGCSGLTSITIPDSVTNIGSDAFFNCSGLTSVTIPDGVTSIGNSAFYGCSGLSSITIPDSVTNIGSRAFYGCSRLTSITIPDSVTSIGYEAFSGCSGLTTITIPDSVTSIGSDAFSGCSGLTSITIPDSVTSIGSSAFSRCSGLETLYLPRRFAASAKNFSIPSSVRINYFDSHPILTVISTQGTPFPTVGQTTCKGMDLIHACISLPAETDNVRHVFHGWTGTGSVPAAGTETNVTFTIREDSTLTWNFRKDNQIAVSVAGCGTCDFGTQWVADGTTATANIVPTTHLYEIALAGDTNGVWLAGTTLAIPSDRPRDIAVTVTEVKLALDVATAHGTATPAAGRTEWSWGESVTASVEADAPVDGVRYACTGWTGTGSARASGWGSSTTFTIEKDSSIIWNWSEQVLISCEVDCDTIDTGASTNEVFGTVERGYQTHSFNSHATDLVPGSVSVLIDGIETLRDNGAGRLARASGTAPSYVSYGSGTVDYETGRISLAVQSNAAETKVGTVSYSYWTETGPSWIAANTKAGDAVWKARNGNAAEFAFHRSANACAWSLSGDTNGVVLDIDGGLVAVPCDVPRSVRLTVREVSPIEAVSGTGGGPVTWTGTGEWFSAFDETASGGSCLRSRSPDAGNNSLVAATVDGPGTLSFDWRISSGRGHYGRFYVNGSKTNEITRTTDWRSATYVLGDGRHEFAWTYEKGTGATAGEDAAFLDNVVWRPQTLEVALDATNLVWTTDGNAVWTSQIAVSTDGEDAAKSGAVSGTGTSRLSTVVRNAGVLAWKWKADVAGSAGVDVYLDGELLYDDGIYLEGATDWTEVSLAVEGEGDHVVVFEFWNGGTEATLSDCAYIDQVSWTPPKPGITIVDGIEIPTAWLDEAAASFVRVSDGDYETAARSTAANGVNAVWECYIAGLDPTNAAERFEARIEMVDGSPVVRWTPDLNEGGTKAERVYTVEGKAALDGAWGPTNAASRFFRVKVAMPE